MENQKRSLLNKNVPGKAVLFFLLFFITMQSLINGPWIGVAKLQEMVPGAEIPDLTFNYSPERVYGMLEHLGEAGRQFYLTMTLRLDFIFPISYALFFGSLLLFLRKKLDFVPPVQVAFLPVAACLMDFLENGGTILMVTGYPQKLISTAMVTNIFTMVKMGGLMLSMALAVIGFIWLVIKKITGTGN